MHTVDIGTYLGVVAARSICQGSRPAHAAIMRDEDLKNPNLPVKAQYASDRRREVS